MFIGDRLREIRQQMKLSQGDVEKRTGLLRSYISRVENGHTVPSLETLEKMAGALEIPMYQLFYEGEKPPAQSAIVKDETQETGWGNTRKGIRSLRKLEGCLKKISVRDRGILLGFASQVRLRSKTV